MINTFVGSLGHLFILLSFVTATVTAFAYIMATIGNEVDREGWRDYARKAFYLHGAFVFGIVGSLFYIIYKHHFEYHYAWSHSSLTLPVYYMISSFWEGQEGSFLLWIFWHIILGFLIIGTSRKWESSVMAVFCLIQAFLVSMILGVVIGDMKIGSSPFMLLRDVMNAPVFAMNPDYVPEDGTGLNPLLQNYWMVIHPPTMFLGFALTSVPFSFCMAGIWQKNYAKWVKPALPWALVAAAIIGVANVMGAYWAYETLNFGGYWNWDPVENAIFIPWLFVVASIHTMIIFRKNNTALKTSMVLVITSFLLILYATFLTRSGILGNTSVHSFTDLGLSGQLLIYLLFFTGISIYFSVINWKLIPTSEKEATVYTQEFWIFLGATTLCLMAFQVLVPTSIPVYNAIVEAFGGISNLAPPADQVEFYTKFQLWFAIALAIFSGTGQFFFWKKMDGSKLKDALVTPILITMVISAAIIVFGKVSKPSYILLVVASVYAIISNGSILLKFLRSNIKLAGGSIAHIGVALMLIGIMFSSGYSEIVSMNNSGMLIFKDATDQMNQENLLLWYKEPRKMGDYDLVYEGDRTEVKGVPVYVDKKMLTPTDKNYLAVAKDGFTYKGKEYFKQGDTIEIYPENTYHEVSYTKPDGESFTLFPRSQVNPNMGLIASPDIRHYLGKDLYTHVSAITNPDLDKEWSETEEFTVKVGERFFIKDYVAVLEGIDRITESNEVDLQPGDIAVKANIRIYGEDKQYTVSPIYMIRDRMVGRIAAELPGFGMKLTLMNIHPDSDSFTIGANTAQKDYIVLKAIEKPYINVLWIGTIILVIGFAFSITRRFKEFLKSENTLEDRASDNRKKGKHSRKRMLEA